MSKIKQDTGRIVRFTPKNIAEEILEMQNDILRVVTVIETKKHKLLTSRSNVTVTQAAGMYFHGAYKVMQMADGDEI